MTDERLIDIETKLAYQEDLIEELNKTIYQQQQRLDRLAGVCQSLAERIEALGAAKDGGLLSQEKPPHY